MDPMATHPAHALPDHRLGTRSTSVLPRRAQIGRDALYLVSGLPAGLVAFTVFVAGFALAAGLLITLLGVPVLLGTLYALRAVGDVERRRASWLLGRPIVRRPRRWSGGIWRRTTIACADGGAWRDATWSLLLLPLGILGFAAVAALWSAALGLLSSPLWYWALPQEHQDNATLRFLNSHDLTPSLARVAAGLVLIPVAAWVCRGLADGIARTARALLQN
jgi:Putative sensor